MFQEEFLKGMQLPVHALHLRQMTAGPSGPPHSLTPVHDANHVVSSVPSCPPPTDSTSEALSRRPPLDPEQVPPSAQVAHYLRHMYDMGQAQLSCFVQHMDTVLRKQTEHMRAALQEDVQRVWHTRSWVTNDQRYHLILWLLWRHGLNRENGIVLLVLDSEDNDLLWFPPTILVKLLKSIGYAITIDEIFELFKNIAVTVGRSELKCHLLDEEFSLYFGLNRVKTAKTFKSRYICLSFATLSQCALDVFVSHAPVVDHLAKLSHVELLAKIKKGMLPFVANAQAVRLLRAGYPLHRFGESWTGHDRSSYNQLYSKIFVANASHGMFSPDVVQTIRDIVSNRTDYQVGHDGIAKVPACPSPPAEC